MFGIDIENYFIFVLIFGYFVYRFLTRKKRKLKKELKSKRAHLEKKSKHLHWLMEECSNEFKISDLMKAYRENEISGKEKYRGKVVYISGIITRITHVNIDTQYYSETHPTMLLLHRRTRVQCYMFEDDDTPLRDLKKDDEISVYGVIDQYSIDVGDKMGWVLLTECVIPPTEEEK